MAPFLLEHSSLDKLSDNMKTLLLPPKNNPGLAHSDLSSHTAGEVRVTEVPTHPHGGQEHGMPPAKLATSGESQSEQIIPKKVSNVVHFYRITQPSGKVTFVVTLKNGLRLRVPLREILDHVTEAELQTYEHQCYRNNVNMETIYQAKDDMGGWARGTSSGYAKRMEKDADRNVEEHRSKAKALKVSKNEEQVPSLKSNKQKSQLATRSQDYEGAEHERKRNANITEPPRQVSSENKTSNEPGVRRNNSHLLNLPGHSSIPRNEQNAIATSRPKRLTSTQSTEDLAGTKNSKRTRLSSDSSGTVALTGSMDPMHNADSADELWSPYDDPKKPTPRPSSVRKGLSQGQMPSRRPFDTAAGPSKVAQDDPKTTNKRSRAATVTANPPTKKLAKSKPVAVAKKAPPKMSEKKRGKAPAVFSDSEPEVTEEVYDVEAIRGHRSSDQFGTEFLIKWQGYPEEQNTWEPYENLDSSPDIISNYFQSLGQPGPSRS